MPPDLLQTPHECLGTGPDGPDRGLRGVGGRCRVRPTVQGTPSGKWARVERQDGAAPSGGRVPCLNPVLCSFGSVRWTDLFFEAKAVLSCGAIFVEFPNLSAWAYVDAVSFGMLAVKLE